MSGNESWTGIRIDSKLKQWLKVHCIINKTTLNTLIGELIKEYANKHGYSDDK